MLVVFSSLDAIYLEVSAAQDMLRLITSHVAYRRNMTFKINLMPVETLSKIFFEASQGELFTSTNISHACCHWRNISLSTPALWSIIDFGGFDKHFDGDSDKEFDADRFGRNINVFAETLKRTRDYPLIWKSRAGDMKQQLCIEHLFHIDTLQLDALNGCIKDQDSH